MSSAPGSGAPTRAAPPARSRSRSEWSRTAAKWMFHGHLWIGVLTAGVMVLIALTGVLLNHKRPLGLMPSVEHTPSGSFDRSLPLAELARRAEAAVPPEVAAMGVDRMDVRPGDGTIKVRFDDRRVMEVALDLNTGALLHVGERNDVFLQKLHSGEIFGDAWVLLSDAAAVALILLLISGYWVWLYPRSRL